MAEDLLVRWDAPADPPTVAVARDGAVLVEGATILTLPAPLIPRLEARWPVSPLAQLGTRVGVGPLAGTLWRNAESIAVRFSIGADGLALVPASLGVIGALRALRGLASANGAELDAWAARWTPAPQPRVDDRWLELPAWRTIATDALRFCAFHGDDSGRWTVTIGRDGGRRVVVRSRDRPEALHAFERAADPVEVAKVVARIAPAARPVDVRLTGYDHNLVIQLPRAGPPYPTVHLGWEIEMGAMVGLKPGESDLVRVVLAWRDRAGG